MEEAQPSLDRFSSATIESLRARLLAERAASKEAREQTQEIAAKVSKLQSRLDAETENRRKAQVAMLEVLEALKTKGIAMDQVMASSSSSLTLENLICDETTMVSLNHLKWTNSENSFFNGEKKDDRSSVRSLPSSQEGQEQTNSDNQSSSELVNSDRQSSAEQTHSGRHSCFCEEIACQVSKEGISAKETLENQHSEGDNCHGNGLDVRNKDILDHITRAVQNSEDRDKDNSGHIHMVESNTMSEDFIERGIVKQSPSPSSVDETLAKYGDVVSDASSSRFGYEKAASDEISSESVYERVASGEISSEFGHGGDSLTKQASYPSDTNSTEAVKQSPILNSAEETLVNHTINGKFSSSSGFRDGRDGVAKQIQYLDKDPQRYDDNSTSNYPRYHTYSNKKSAQQMAYMDHLAGSIPIEAYPGFNSASNSWPSHKLTRASNYRQMHNDIQIHDVSTEAPFANLYYRGGPGYFPRTTYQNRDGEFSMLNRMPKTKVSEPVLSLMDEKNGKLGNILGALHLAKQHLNERTSTHIPAHKENNVMYGSSVLPSNLSGKPYGGYCRDGSYQQSMHYWKSKGQTETPIIHLPPSPTADQGFNRYNAFSGYSYMPAGNGNGYESDHLPPRGEVHLGNGITLYTD